MATRTLQLVSYRNSPAQRAHFAVYVPSANPEVGTMIHAVGAPMVGYQLEFKRNHSPAESRNLHTTVPIGEVDVQNIADSTTTAISKDSTPRGNLETAASQVPTPGASENFMAPVNDVSSLDILLRTADHLTAFRPPTKGVRNGQWSMCAVSFIWDISEPTQLGSFNQNVIRRLTVLVCNRSVGVKDEVEAPVIGLDLERATAGLKSRRRVNISYAANRLSIRV